MLLPSLVSALLRGETRRELAALTPMDSEKELDGKVRAWCEQAWSHNAKWATYCEENFGEYEALAGEFAVKLKAVKDQTAQAQLDMINDPLKQLEWSQSKEATQLHFQQNNFQERFFAARTARHNWLVAKESIASIDATVTRVCNEHKNATALHEKQYADAKLLQVAASRLHKTRAFGEPDLAAGKSAALKALQGRQKRLEIMGRYCEAEAGYAAQGEAAKKRIKDRRANVTAEHEAAIKRIEERMAKFTDICQEIADDGKAFAEIADLEKEHYSELSSGKEALPKSKQTILDGAHDDWMTWRKAVREVYEADEEKCAQRKHLMKMRIVGRQEKIAAANPAVSPLAEEAENEKPPAICPDDAELKKNLDDVKAKIKDVESW